MSQAMVGIETPESVAEVAAGWLARRQDGMDEREREAFIAWLSADPRHKQAYDEISQTWEELGAMAPMARISAFRSAALMSIPRRKRAMPWLTGIAAAVVAVVGISALPYASDRFTSSGRIAGSEAAALAPGELRTMRGERSTMALDDGSTITLNTSTRVRISYTPAERRIVMLAGQAFFQVAHDKSRPFIVSTGDREVLAVGTQFEVRVERDQVAVALLEGRVKVRPRTDVAGSARPATPVEAILGPGERLQFALASTATLIKPADVEELTIWREGRVKFDETPLAAAVAEMNRYASIPIRIGDPTLADMPVSGVFRTGQTDSFVSALTQLFPVQARRTEAAIELRRVAS